MCTLIHTFNISSECGVWNGEIENFHTFEWTEKECLFVRFYVFCARFASINCEMKEKFVPKMAKL